MVIQVVAPPLAVGIVGLVVSNATKVGQSVAVAVLAVFIILQLRGKYPGHHVSTFTLKTSYSKNQIPVQGETRASVLAVRSTAPPEQTGLPPLLKDESWRSPLSPFSISLQG